VSDQGQWGGSLRPKAVSCTSWTQWDRAQASELDCFRCSIQLPRPDAVYLAIIVKRGDDVWFHDQNNQVDEIALLHVFTYSITKFDDLALCDGSGKKLWKPHGTSDDYVNLHVFSEPLQFTGGGVAFDALCELSSHKLPKMMRPKPPFVPHFEPGDHVPGLPEVEYNNLATLRQAQDLGVRAHNAPADCGSGVVCNHCT